MYEIGFAVTRCAHGAVLIAHAIVNELEATGGVDRARLAASLRATAELIVEDQRVVSGLDFQMVDGLAATLEGVEKRVLRLSVDGAPAGAKLN